MKKLIILFLIVLSVNSYSQKINLGIEAGFNSSTFFNHTGSANQNSNTVGLGNINSYQIGGIAEFNFGAGFYGQTGLSFSNKGTDRFNVGQSTYGPNSTIKISYLQIPVNLEFKQPLNKSKKLIAIAAAGFYIARGISGSEKGIEVNNNGINTTINNPVRFTNDNTYNPGYTSVNPLDVGYNLVAGIQYYDFQLKFNFNKGFSKVLPNSSDIKFVNNVVNISAVYLIKIK